MTQDVLKKRTKVFAIKVIKLTRELPPGRESDVIGKQLLRSATSVAANYRSVCRARSKADFISKMGIVEEEADESCFWMELLIEAGITNGPVITALLKEANELTAIFTASNKTSKGNRN